MSATRCPEPDVLLACGEGVLPEALEREAQEHLAECALCRQLIEDLRSPAFAEPTLEELTRMERTVFSAKRKPLTWTIVGAIAAAVLVATLASLWMQQPGSAPKNETIATALKPALLPKQPPEPKLRLPLEPAPLRLPLAAAAVFRGRAAEHPGLDLEALGEALAPYRAGDYADAEDRLRNLAERFPAAVEPHFYLGVSELFAGDPQAATSDLEAARRIGGEALDDEIAWYLAIARERSGSWQDAAKLLEGLCDAEGLRQKQACEALGR
ncbi:MAG: hypothetical protein R2748_26590 [Bryobacterales bacterium]